jgi:hypothetical protein
VVDEKSLLPARYSATQVVVRPYAFQKGSPKIHVQITSIMAEMTRFVSHWCPSWITMASHQAIGVVYPKNCPKVDVVGSSQPKRKNRKGCINSIWEGEFNPLKFSAIFEVYCILVTTDTEPEMENNIKDGGGCILNLHERLKLRPIMIDLDEI